MTRKPKLSAAGDGRASPPIAGHFLHLAFKLLHQLPVGWRRARLWSELILLFIGIPLVLAVFFRTIASWGALGAFTMVGILLSMAAIAVLLLAITPGFSFWRLLSGPVLREWKLILFCTLAVAGVSVGVALLLLPHRVLVLPFYDRPEWLLVLGAYPLLSAFPQELIYRALFFERYGALFPGTLAASVANGAAFGFGHIIYMHSLTIALTAAWGVVAGWAYLTRGRSMLLTWVMHSIAGWLIFTSGLGAYFHSGSVTQIP